MITIGTTDYYFFPTTMTIANQVLLFPKKPLLFLIFVLKLSEYLETCFIIFIFKIGRF